MANLSPVGLSAHALEAWQKAQMDYTLPLHENPAEDPAIEASKPLGIPATKETELSGKQKAVGAVVGITLGSMAYASYAIPAVTAVAAGALAQLQAGAAAVMLVLAAGAATPIGVGVILAATSLTSIAADRTLNKLRLATLGIMTHNIGGGDISLLEFFGKGYTPELDAFRDQVHAAVLPQRTYIQGMSDETVVEEYKKLKGMDTLNPPSDPKQIAGWLKGLRQELLDAGKVRDSDKGLTLSQVTGVTEDFDLSKEEKNSPNAPPPPFNVIRELKRLQGELNTPDNMLLTDEDIANFAGWIKKFGKADPFNFLHGITPKFAPYEVAKVDGTTETRTKVDGTTSMLKLEGPTVVKPHALPFLASDEEVSQTPKLTFLNTVFKKEFFEVLKSEAQKDKFAPEVIQRNIAKELDLTVLRDKDGNLVTEADLQFFCTPAGQLLFYWLYNAEEFDLVEKAGITPDKFNTMKAAFKRLKGTPQTRAAKFVKDDVLAFGVNVLHAQECSKVYADELAKNGFHVEYYPDSFCVQGKEHSKEATFTNVFLHKKYWKNIQFIQHHFQENPAKLVVVLATERKTNDEFLHVSIHGDSKNPNEGLNRIKEAIRIFKEVQAQKGHQDLSMLIGMDANTKTPQARAALTDLMAAEGLQMTDFGPTTIKIRALTTQQPKGGERVKDSGDHVATGSLAKHGWKVIGNFLGGKAKRAKIELLPSIKNPSDHFTVQITIQKTYTVWGRIKSFFTWRSAPRLAPPPVRENKGKGKGVDNKEKKGPDVKVAV